MGLCKQIAAYLLALGALATWAVGSLAAAEPQPLPTGQLITPTAAPGAIFQPLNPDVPADPSFLAGQASAVALSPDGRTLLIVTSGFNRMFGPDGRAAPGLSSEFVFVFDVSGKAPVKRQIIAVPNTFLGLAWAPDGTRFYVSGGVDDVVYEYAAGPGGLARTRTFPLGHQQGVGLAVKPAAGALAVSPDGKRLLVANFQNDSVSVIDLSDGKTRETDLRPGAGTPGGSFPRAAAWASSDEAYVASERDREIIGLRISGAGVEVGARIKTPGQPVALVARGARLYAALDNTDRVAVVDIARNRIDFEVAAGGGQARLKGLGGADTNALSLSADGRTLYAANGGANDVAVIALGRKGAAPRLAGLIPTGWYPTAVAASADGSRLFVVNGKSVPGPNPGGKNANQYVWQLEKAGFLTLPSPSAAELARLTRRTVANNHLMAQPDAPATATMAFLRQHIRHLIYVVKENRTYDQILGDLEVGNGDPKLALFGTATTPNQHALARQFVDLDAFYDTGESSNTGWNWSTAARTTDFTEREAPVNYAGRGLQYDQEGDNRNINVGYATAAERVAASPLSPKDPDVLPGARDVAAPDGPDGDEGRGYLWDAAIRAKLDVRNYGFFGDLARYFPSAGPALIPLDRDPAKSGRQVFYAAKAALMPRSDPYFRGFDQALADYWREAEWAREFDGFVASGKAPGLMLVRLGHDHTGSFKEALDGVDTPEKQVADNDYAVGLLVEKVARSPFAKDTLIFIVEDDAQDGPDHVDAHRSVAFIAGPYVKRGAVVSERFSTVDLLATIEDILGIGPMGLNDATARPMAAVFDPARPDWTFEAKVPAPLRSSQLPLPPPGPAEAACSPPAGRGADYWAAVMAGQDFGQEDRLDTPRYNLALWRGLEGGRPYPEWRDAADLSHDRPALLAASLSVQESACAP
jgi:DNA-binding beta-propeller fold protein YncE